MSMAKLKEHATCGVTLTMKNCFGNTPASIYGDDAGVDEPNEAPEKGRVNVCHFGKRQPAKAALPEIDPASSREPGYRMPRITAELAAARPIDIAFIDGVETVTGGEGPWIRGLQFVRPGVLILGTNGLTTDTVGTAVMGFDPRAERGTAPFSDCDNTLLRRAHGCWLSRSQPHRGTGSVNRRSTVSVPRVNGRCHAPPGLAKLTARGSGDAVARQEVLRFQPA
jgi:hypothetical protein